MPPPGAGASGPDCAVFDLTCRATAAADAPLPNQATMPFHSAPEPMAAGMASEASKRNVALVSARYLADSLSIGSTYRLWSTLVFADTQPGATLMRLSAHCGVDR